MSSSLEFHEQIKTQLLQAIWHLAYSAKKVQSLPTQSDDLDNATLEIWESFCARFSRVADLFLMKYIKSAIRLEDPGFNGTFRDFLNQAEKLRMIDDFDSWFKIRELRNTISHEYAVQDLGELFNEVRKMTPIVLRLQDLFSS